MQLEDYFDFLTPEDIRIQGTGVGIEHILYEYIHWAQTSNIFQGNGFDSAHPEIAPSGCDSRTRAKRHHCTCQGKRGI